MKKLAENIVEISKKDISDTKKFTKVKEGSDFKPGDYINVLDDLYAIISNGHPLIKKGRVVDSVYRKNN